MASPLRIAFVPEHFSTPLAFAAKKFGLAASLFPFPSGTGAMIAALRAGEVDVAIGLTEGFIAGLGKADVAPGGGGYRLIGTYVTTPLCWAILTGTDKKTPKHSPISSVADLQGKKIGVSRLGSGSHVMGYVLADQQGWLSPDNPEPWSGTEILDNFSGLIKGVNGGDTGSSPIPSSSSSPAADFFLWETFTSSRAISRGEIRKVGEIYTPWPSWLVVASTSTTATAESVQDKRLEDMFAKIDKGIEHFNNNRDEAVKYICSVMDYSEEDARKWLDTVNFQAGGVKGVDLALVDSCIAVLRKAGVLVEGDGMTSDEMVSLKR